MLITMLRAKIHRAAVTGASLDYEGSLTISADLAAAAGLLEFEKILVGNITNGERFETYVILGEPGKGQIILNGATAHLGKIGDRLVIMSFAALTPEEAAAHRPRAITLNERNQIIAHGSSSDPSPQG